MFLTGFWQPKHHACTSEQQQGNKTTGLAYLQAHKLAAQVTHSRARILQLCLRVGQLISCSCRCVPHQEQHCELTPVMMFRPESWTCRPWESIAICTDYA